MILIPHVRLEGTTTLSAIEIRRRMLEFLAESPPAEAPAAVMATWGSRYAGRVDAQGFELAALNRFKQPYLPVFAGGFTAEGARTRVSGVLWARQSEVVALAVVVLCVVALSGSLAIAGLGVALHAMAYFFGFLPHQNGFTAWLERLPEWEWS
jgi:hypothetical protein